MPLSDFRDTIPAMRVVLAEQRGVGTIDRVEHAGAEHLDVPAVAVELPLEVERGEYAVRAVFGDHGEFGVQLEDTIVWIPVPPEVLEEAEQRGLLAVVTGEADEEGELPYFLIHWHRPAASPSS